ncbi:Fur family transcriptional regulator [Hydrogenophaga sp. T2]|uniref:Fur family transcriptional regulator n=1 Tax=Hydrogenophaga sp. T2 TaxID=3132823 RepID=UPI003CF6FDC3
MPRPSAEADAVPEHVQARLDAAGLRRTLATRAVLGVFLARPGQGLTHAQVLQALHQRGHEPNRVTLYRLLDRLAACQVLARHSDDRRTWRFTLQGAEAGARAAPLVPRFECRRCGQDRALGALPAAGRGWLRALQRGLARQGDSVERVELALRGVCAPCSAGGGA